MKKLIACLMLAALTLSLCGCGILGLLLRPNNDPEPGIFSTDEPIVTERPTSLTPTESAPEPDTEPETAPETEPARVYDNSLIGESYAEDGTYTDDFGYESNYSYHVPFLLASTPDAQAINTRITKDFGTVVAEQLNDMENNYSMMYFDILWDAYWHDSVVFLVIHSTSDWGFTNYGVYCYDFAAEKELSKDEILEMAGLSRQKFLDAMTAAAGEEYVNQYAELPEDYKDEFYDRQYNWTVSAENINMDLQFYLDDSGRLTVVTPIGSIAGADWYYHIVYPNY